MSTVMKRKRSFDDVPTTPPCSEPHDENGAGELSGEITRQHIMSTPQALTLPATRLTTNKSPIKVQGGGNKRHSPGGKMHCDIHGDIIVHPVLKAIIDTPCFQRLRKTRQLGMANYVYATATHTRFEHCIGTSYLAEKLVNSLYANLPAHIKECYSETDLLCVRIAALIHDLGHGPWSHSWDSSIADKADNWSHEKGSCLMLDHMLDTEEDVRQIFKDFGLLTESNLDFIKEIITTESNVLEPVWPFKSRPESHAWLFEIVSNHRFGVDVDRMDYLQRDAAKCGLEATCKNVTSRYLDDARVNQESSTKRWIITVPEKDRINIFEGLFQLRYKMHGKVYQHKTVVVIEMMIKDMLNNSQKIFQKLVSPNLPELRHAHRDMAHYELMTEEGIQTLVKLSEITNNSDPDFAVARKILTRIHRRQLYRVIERTDRIPSKCQPKRSQAEFFRILKSHEVFSEDSHSQRPRRALFPSEGSAQSEREEVRRLVDGDLFEVSASCFNYGSKSANPLKNLYYFSKNSTNIKASGTLDAAIVPTYFQSRKYMLIYKGEDRIPELLKEKIASVFKKYHEETFSHDLSSGYDSGNSRSVSKD